MLEMASENDQLNGNDRKEQALACTISSTQRKIDKAKLIGSSKEYMADDDKNAAEEHMYTFVIDPMLLDEEPISAKVEHVPKPMYTTRMTSVTVVEKPNPPKKAKFEPVLLTSSKPNLMAANMETKPKTGSQCNFGSIVIALITNFLAASKDDENDNENDNDTKHKQALTTYFLECWPFLYEDPKTHDTNKIYRLVFMLELIESAHINMIAGFLNVPALNIDALQLKSMQAVIAASAAALKCAFNFAAKPKVFVDDLSTGTSSMKGSNKACKIPLKHNNTDKVWGEYTANTITLVHQCQEAAKKLKSAPVEELKPKGKCPLLSLYLLHINVSSS
ncbi:hypothetical protein EV702DRAFT_1053248 [Suillus placidus]|uniref:Uncharacterized protein n=1 Tax=Suillus placidus TaxID=48579 RepID=A0A9P6ZEU1_9AGAM|nr:hypothetical protein EV702DRAFT_1053248 [Suillus placidus]